MNPPDPSRAADASEVVEVWVELTVPALASAAADDSQARSALRARILAQQDEVMRQLAALGAAESARIQQTSNAIAVKTPRATLEAISQIEGVKRVRPVTHRHRIHE